MEDGSAEPMQPGELRVVREHLGLSGEQLAALLGVASRSVRRWESSERDEDGEIRWPVPDGIRQAVESLEADAAAQVGAMVDALLSVGDDRAVVTFRSDAEMASAHPGTRFPASWHRALVGRAIQDVPGVRVAFLTDALEDGCEVRDTLVVVNAAPTGPGRAGRV